MCQNSLPEGKSLPAQWSEEGLRVRVRSIPCSGKIDAQYLMHALEGGAVGVCVLACEKGDCTLTQGNYRAEMRVRTVQRLLREIGADEGRAEFINVPKSESIENIKRLISGAAQRFSRLTGVVA
jgi:coenzyme F420-reducing hydrogenase delta subunit